MTKTIRLTLCAALLATSPATAFAAGNHFGWCIGVGNQHSTPDCGAPPATGGSTPATVPIANQLPPTGTAPTPPSTPATIYVTPERPASITGTGQVPPVTGQTAPPITGVSPGPIVIEPVPPTVFTGVGPVPPLQTLPTPSFTGGERQMIVIRPLPPTTFTGTTPRANVQGTPAPSFAGQGMPTIVVVPNTPTTLVGYGPVASAIIVEGAPGPGFSGSRPVPPQPPRQTGTVPGRVPTATPPATPVLAPTARPVASPVPTPQLVPGATPTATPVLVPRPRPRTGGPALRTPGDIAHRPVARAPGVGRQHVTQLTGRQPAHLESRFAARDGGRPWHCVASGHGKRRSLAGGERAARGALRHVGSVDVLGRDLPALHPGHAHCVIVVRRRTD